MHVFALRKQMPLASWRHRLAQLFVKQRRGRRLAPPVGKMGDAQNAHRAGKRDRQHVVRSYYVSGRLNAPAVDTNVTGSRKRGGKGARLYNTRVPEPAINALLLARHESLAFVLLLRLKAGLQFE